MKAVVFDIGNVLIRWDPRLAFAGSLGGMREAAHFLERVGFAGLNLRADAGESFAALAREIADPLDRGLVESYPRVFAQTIAEPIEGTWDLLERLRMRGLQIHAITNWSAETWPTGLATHARLGTAFAVTIVSGREGVLKPDPRIFGLLCERADLAPQDCLFIDDSPANVAGAQDFGMQAELFTAPAALETALKARGLL